MVKDKGFIVETFPMVGIGSNIIIQKCLVEVDEDKIINNFKDRYNQMKAGLNVQKIQLKTKDITLNGQRLTITISSITMTQDIYFVKKKAYTTLLILQDNHYNKNENSEAFKKMMKIFKESFKIRKE